MFVLCLVGFVGIIHRAVFMLSEDSVKAAIDAQLATRGYGKICVDGPNSPTAFVVDRDSGANQRLHAKELVTLGFARVKSTAPIDGTLQTTYELTAAGRRSYTTYEKLRSSGDYHGWCFAEFRVGRIVRSTPPAYFMGHLWTTVTYYPRIIHVEDWAKKTPATSVPEIRALASFELETRTQTLMQTSDGWGGTPSQ